MDYFQVVRLALMVLALAACGSASEQETSRQRQWLMMNQVPIEVQHTIDVEAEAVNGTVLGSQMVTDDETFYEATLDLNGTEIVIPTSLNGWLKANSQPAGDY